VSHIFEIITYLFIGSVAGFVGGLLGVGGGMIVVPSLLLVFYFLNFSSENTMQIAIGTSLAAMIFTSMTSAWAHTQQGGVNWKLFNLLFPGIALGTFFGAFIAHGLHTQQLQILFGVLIFLFGIYFILTASKVELEKNHASSLAIASLTGFAIGLISSIMGIGGGIITVPLVMLYGNPLRKAISTSAATGAIIAVMGTIFFFYFGWNQSTLKDTWGYIYVPAFISIGLAAVIMAPLGAKYTYRAPTVLLKRCFGVLQILVGLAMIIFE
jgi:uncharacterized membrane protein YfcA